MASCISGTAAVAGESATVVGGFFVTVGAGIAALGTPVLLAFGVGAVACGATTACLYEEGCCGEIKIADETLVVPGKKSKRIERGQRRPIRRATARPHKKYRGTTSKKKISSKKLTTPKNKSVV